MLRTFADWRVIADTESQGTYMPPPAIPIADPLIAAWLLEATLLASETESTDFNGLLHSPALFPFQLIRLSSYNLTQSGRIDVVRQGIDQELVFVRRPPPVPRKDPPVHGPFSPPGGSRSRAPAD